MMKEGANFGGNNLMYKNLLTSVTSILWGLAIAQTSWACQPDEIDFDELIEIAERYDCPQPKATDRLALGWNDSWRTIDKATSRNAGIYQACFVTQIDDAEPELLMGFKRAKRTSRHGIPALRDFTLTDVKENRDGYTVLHNHVSCFETSIQLARLGKRETAKKLWDKFIDSDYVDGGSPQENISRFKKTPKSLLAWSIYNYYTHKSLQTGADLKNILVQLRKLRNEFPELFSEDRRSYFEYDRNQFVDDLTLSVVSEKPAKGTVEESLLKWADENHNSQYFGRTSPLENEAIHEIFDRGVNAMPLLVKLVDDRRLSRHIRYGFGNGHDYRLRVGDLASMLLQDLAGATSPIKDNWTTPAPDAWQVWLSETDLSDEAKFFERAAFNPNSGRVFATPIRILEAQYPALFEKLVETISLNSTKDSYIHYAADAIHDSKTLSVEDKSRLLSMMFHNLPDSRKRMPIQSLATINKKLTGELLLPLIEKFPRDVEEPYWTCEAAALTHVVMHLDDKEIWKKYYLAAKNASVGLRMEMMNPMNYTYISDKNRGYRLEFMSRFLDDPSIRDQTTNEEMFNGPCAAFTFEKISVRNFVAIQLASMMTGFDDYPNASWTPEQWEALREKVRTQLDQHELPNFLDDSKE